MRTLLLLAHGSRREASNREVAQMAERLAVRLPGFAAVQAAFLELAEPSIGAGIDHQVAAGAREVLLLPYFLAAGRHVAEDIPAIVEEKRRQYPQVRVELLPYLGEAEGLADLLAAQVLGH